MSREDSSLGDLIKDLQVFVELSFQEDDISLRQWITETINSIDGHCWERKKCSNVNCPAYKNECGRCWLIAGTMCGGNTSGTFARKYGSCLECDVYKETLGSNPFNKLRELIIVLIHSLRLKQNALLETLEEVKVLSGFLPICASCKNIRDDKGYWKQIEDYIRDHSEAEFSHSICPECLKKLYPDFVKKN